MKLPLRSLCRLCVVASLLLSSASIRAQEQQKKDLELMRVLAPTNAAARPESMRHDATWEAWQQRTGELPPDSRRCPRLPFLPDPLAACARARNGPRGASS